MTEVWLRANMRAIWLGTVLPAGVAALGALAAWGALGNAAWLRWFGALLAAGAALVVVSLLRMLRQPRLALRDRRLLVYLTHGLPEAVPIELVEGFLLGQAPALLPGRKLRVSETRTLLIRLAERAVEWSRRDVKPALGKWCEGYITIRGTWCEPLGMELVTRLNRRLAEVQRQSTAASAGVMQ